MEAGNNLQVYTCHEESNQQWGRDYARSILEKREIAGHNPSACVENKGFDNDCCAIKGTAECKSDFKFVDTDIVCWDGGDWQAFNYYCVNTDKKEVKKLGQMLKNHDPSRCRENKKFDNDCCAIKGTGACSNFFNYIDTDDVCYEDKQWKAYKYYCEDPTKTDSGNYQDSIDLSKPFLVVKNRLCRSSVDTD